MQMTEVRRTKVKPSDINTNVDHMWDTFGRMETEVSAKWLVKLAQQNGDWRDFSRTDIVRFSKQDFSFNGLVRRGFIRDNGDGTYSFSDQFIEKCYQKFPAK